MIMTEAFDEQKWFSVLERFDTQMRSESLFNNPSRLLAMIEQEHRKRASGIINNPYHNCLASSCSMIPLNVTLYRRTWMAASGGPVSAEAAKGQIIPAARDSTLDDSFANERIHVCFVDSCEHLHRARDHGHGQGHGRDHGHAVAIPCSLGVACPHFSSYPTRDTYVFEKLFVCKQSGALHACGERCIQRFTSIGDRNRCVCPLSGLDLGTQFDTGGYMNAGPYSQGSMLMIGYGDTDIAPAAGASSRRDIAAHLQREQEDRHRFVIAYETIMDLLLSPQRQKIEFQNIMSTHEKMQNEVNRIARRRRPHPNFMTPPAVRAHWMLLLMKPRNHYFRVFPVAASMRAEIAMGMHHLSNNVPPRRPIIMQLARDEIAANQARIASLIGGVTPPAPHSQPPHRGGASSAGKVAVTSMIMEDKKGGGAGGGAGELGAAIFREYADENEQWRKNIAAMIETAARIVVLVYDNLAKFSDVFARQRMTLSSFRSLYIHIIYIMRTGHRVPVTMKTEANLEQSCNVTVIPKIDIMALLPSQIALGKFETVQRYVTNMRQYIVVQTELMHMYTAIVRAGGIWEMDVRPHEMGEGT